MLARTSSTLPRGRYLTGNLVCRSQRTVSRELHDRSASQVVLGRIPIGGAPTPKPIDTHCHAIGIARQGVFHELGLAA
jgi:hypothetical protein